MIVRDTKIRVRYGEVDRMGFLYHSHYVEYFDVARTELIRSLGISNLELEEKGIMLPVVKLEIKYGIPANYDDELTIRTTLREMPGVTITFHYEVLRGEQTLTTGSVTLAFMRSDTKKAVRPPKELLDLLTPYFEK